MSDSILDSVKDMIAGGHVHDHFDDELINAINAVFVDYRQEGIGPPEGFSIHSNRETWEDFLGESLPEMGSIQTLTALKVRMMFDPQANSTIMEILKDSIDRLEWRLYADYEVTHGIDE
jgi:hypothetical protein